MKSDIPSSEFWADQLRIGNYVIDKSQLKNVCQRTKYTRLYELTPFVPLNDPKGMWTFDQVN